MVDWRVSDSKRKKDYDAMEDLATELYEVYGWFGEPYYTH